VADLFYLANNRLPTEKAHGLQIVQMCEAFADAGYKVTLITPRRRNTPEMNAVGSLWTYYGVKRNFDFRRLSCLDLFHIIPDRVPRVAFLTQTVTYLVVLWFWLLFHRADVLYTRDIYVALILALTRRKLVYEPHQAHTSRLGRRIQGYIVRRAQAVIPITAHLSSSMEALGADPARLLVAHDAIQRARFEQVPSQSQARAEIGWPQEAFIVGWAGRLHLMGVDKGVGLLVDALRLVEGASLAVVGGPDDMVEALRQRWISAGLDETRFWASGQVTPERVPLYLSAFDICAMPHPWTEYFAYYTSPIKLFEYMASGRAIVASDLPGFAEVVQDGESALLVPPGNAQALADAVTRLRTDPALRERLAQRAHSVVMSCYTWEARARAIKNHIDKFNQDSPCESVF
jgi:glycosyltransferase involved in cell wall biosynthesis